jgi:hypothetical protein
MIQLSEPIYLTHPPRERLPQVTALDSNGRNPARASTGF